MLHVCSAYQDTAAHTLRAMSAASSKRRKLAELRGRMKFISGAALEDVLTIIRDNPDAIPEGVVSRHSIRRGRDEFVQEPTPYGILHSTITVAGLELEVQNPAPALYLAATQPGFAPLLQRALRNCTTAANGVNDFDVCVYSDEIGPGNQVAYKQARKTWSMYWSIRQFGPESLMNEDTASVDVTAHMRSA